MIADADHNGKRFVVRADEKLTAFFEMESAIADQAKIIQIASVFARDALTDKRLRVLMVRRGGVADSTVLIHLQRMG